MFGVEGGFDVVISNPTYINNRSNDKETKEYWKLHYASSNFGKTNTYEIFIECGLNLLKTKGNLVFIVPIVLLNIETCKALRELIITKYKIAEIAYGEFSVFEYANVDTMVISLINDKPNDKTAIRVRRFSEGYKSVILEHNLEVKNITKDNYYKISVKSDPVSKKLLLRKEDYTNISSVFDFYNGIATGPNKEKYFSFEKTNNNYKPLVMGNNIGHYVINYEGRFINYDRKKLHRPREESIFLAKEKIVMQRIRNLKLKKRLVCALDTNSYYTFNSVNNLLLKENSNYNIRYFLALLNSVLMNYLLKQFSLNTNITLSDLDELPIRIIDFKKVSDKKIYEEVVKLVTKILTAKRVDPQANTSALEGEIDQLVYQLYGLSEDEIEIVENKT